MCLGWGQKVIICTVWYEIALIFRRPKYLQSLVDFLKEVDLCDVPKLQISTNSSKGKIAYYRAVLPTSSQNVIICIVWYEITLIFHRSKYFQSLLDF